MKEVFAYVIGLGAAVMMPLIFTVLGVCIGIRPAKALKSGLLVGVGFVGLGVVTALVIGHPATLVASILLMPAILFLSVVLPGNKFLPLASLAGIFYIFPCVLPVTGGNVPKTFVTGLVAPHELCRIVR